MHILLGIGNPGAKYEKTPHNIGFSFVESFSEKGKAKIQHKALTEKIMLESEPVLLAKPTTFVNLSGESAQALLSYYKLDSRNLIVITDDVNLEFGAIRVRTQGSHGGHNGLASIIQHCGENFVRIRIGIGQCPPHMQLSNFVLRKLKKEELTVYQSMIPVIQDLVKTGIAEGWERAAARFNRKSL